MPIKAVQRRFTGSRDIRLMLVGVDQAYSTSAVQSALTDLLRERRNITGGKDDDFNIFDTKQISDTLTSTTTMLTRIVAAVAAISLVVGGIGIMNIMLVSVTERTREIGIRLAIGAVAREVLMQFLVEAVVLSCLGGIIGLILAQAIIALLVPLMQVPWTFDPQINVIAFAISAVIGVVFGYFPRGGRRPSIRLTRYGTVIVRSGAWTSWRRRSRSSGVSMSINSAGAVTTWRPPATSLRPPSSPSSEQRLELASTEHARRGGMLAVARHHDRIRPVKGVEQAINVRRGDTRHIGQRDQDRLGRRLHRLAHAKMQRVGHALTDIVIMDDPVTA